LSAILVDPLVTSQKFKQELDLWEAHSEHQRRGWILLNRNDATPSVELAFLAGIATSVPVGPLPVVVCAVRLDYENYDLWPPSLTFIDAFTRQPMHPHVRAFLSTPEGPRDVLVEGHPSTNFPFLCVPGIREYHWHPQHTGDDWLLHRPAKEGSISTICDRIWRMMAKNVVGLQVMVQTLPVVPLQAQVLIQVVQGEVGGIPLGPASGIKLDKSSK
jgi:Predicted metal binding domain